MSYDGGEPDTPEDSDLRKRAAWLLALLVVAAGLLVLVLTTLVGSPKSPGQRQGAGPDDSLLASSAPPTPSSSSTPRAVESTTPPPRTSSPPSAPTTSSRATTVDCARLCIVDTDIGNAVAALNKYRAASGQQPIPGAVSKAAQMCAYTNGGNCTGGYAESQVAEPNGAAAVAKVARLADLLDPGLKSFEVGWAYDPQGHQYYFAVIRHS